MQDFARGSLQVTPNDGAINHSLFNRRRGDAGNDGLERIGVYHALHPQCREYLP